MKNDNKQVNDIARKYGMTKVQRREFGDYLESEKKRGAIGTYNQRGDFTYKELEEKAREFLGME